MKIFAIVLLASLKVNAFTLASTQPFTVWPSDQITVDWSDNGCSMNIENFIFGAAKEWNTIHTSRMKFSKGVNLNMSLSDIATAYAGGTLVNPVIACDADFENDFGSGIAMPFSGVNNGRLGPGLLILNSDPSSDNDISISGTMNVQHTVAYGFGMFAGLGSSQYAPAIMYPQTGSRLSLAVAQDDADGLSYLYPSKASMNDLFGCGVVQNAPPPEFRLLVLILFLPLLMAVGLRYRTRLMVWVYR